jgi:hypothetical protein
LFLEFLVVIHPLSDLVRPYPGPAPESPIAGFTFGFLMGRPASFDPAAGCATESADRVRINPPIARIQDSDLATARKEGD